VNEGPSSLSYSNLQMKARSEHKNTRPRMHIYIYILNGRFQLIKYNKGMARVSAKLVCRVQIDHVLNWKSSEARDMKVN
jgi:hypothetical protein